MQAFITDSIEIAVYKTCFWLKGYYIWSNLLQIFQKQNWINSLWYSIISLKRYCIENLVWKLSNKDDGTEDFGFDNEVLKPQSPNHFYIFSSELNISLRIKMDKKIPVYSITHNYFKSTVFSSTIIKWNKL